MPSTWVATTSQGRMVGDYISTSYGSDNLAHGVFATAAAPTSGTSCSSVLDNCREPASTFVPGLTSGSVATANDPVLLPAPAGPARTAYGTLSTTTAPSTATDHVGRSEPLGRGADGSNESRPHPRRASSANASLTNRGPMAKAPHHNPRDPRIGRQPSQDRLHTLPTRNDDNERARTGGHQQSAATKAAAHRQG